MTNRLKIQSEDLCRKSKDSYENTVTHEEKGCKILDERLKNKIGLY